MNVTPGMPVSRPRESAGKSIYARPYDSISAAVRLEYYRARDSVQFFSVPSPEETCRERIDALLEDRFEANGESYRLCEPLDWLSNPSRDRQWHIVLHKCYFAAGLGLAYQATHDRRYLQKWIALTTSWMAQVPPLFVNSQVTGRRIQNWIYAYYYFVASGDASADVPAAFHEAFLESLHEQVTLLRENLDTQRNHRTLELYAIFLAAVVFPEWSEARAWQNFALCELLVNLRTDLLPDGVQCELSSEYHHLVLKNGLCVLRLARLNGITVAREFEALLRAALVFSLHVHKPDGLIPSLSDGDTGSYLDLLQQGADYFGCPEMRYVATRGREGKPPGERSRVFPDSGYCIVRSGWGQGEEAYEDERYLVFDCGPIGAGDHGHLDLLSFELAAYGHSLVVDPGRCTYDEEGDTNWRAVFRGTAYHNTVLVDGKNQANYERAGKKCAISGPAPGHELVAFVSESGFDYLHGIARSCEYDAVHERRMFFNAGQYWIVWDRLSAQAEHDYEQLYHLSHLAFGKADIETSGGTARVHAPNLIIACAERPDVTVAIEDAFISQTYGVKVPAPVVRVGRRAGNAVLHAVLFPFRDRAPKVNVCELEVTQSSGTPAANDTRALAVSVEAGGSGFTDICYFTSCAGMPRRFAGYSFDGEYLALRLGEDGDVVWRHMSSGARLARVDSECEMAHALP
ncbi:MAG: alginate lyase family protein [Gammaproteobacteria bacterium]